MSEERKGPQKADLQKLFSGDLSDEDLSEIEELEIVGVDPEEERSASRARRPARRRKPEAEPSTRGLDAEERLLRLRADFENYRRRVERGQAEFQRRAAGDLAAELLPVLDNLERALSEESGRDAEAFRKGIELIYRQMIDVLAAAGLEAIESVEKPFDPNVHEAMERVARTDCPDQWVIGELQKGYRFHGKLLRPAMVQVSYRPEEEDDDDGGASGETDQG